MFDRILLPLDGSILAEAAIPYIRDLAAQLKAEVFLLHVCPPEHQAYLHMHQIYLDSIANDLRHEVKQTGETGQEMKIQAETIIGEPIKSIFDYVNQNKINLIGITAHGATGIRP